MGLLNSENDLLEWIRRTFIPPLGMLVSAYNESTGSKLYVQGPTTDNQFVGRVKMGEEDFEAELEEMGFERNPLASLKHLIGTREKEEGSFRWLAPEDSEYRKDYQLHVILYDGSVIPDAETGETYVYAHWEYRWDVAPMKHYRAVNWKPVQGVQMMQTMLTENGIDYDYQLPPTKDNE
ncbi:hypothetical protein M199_gp034 [Halogranum tailed virus 1]|uniref:Uncharacterized protein n=1 Tax=Halogranum tailed virus 1 TaxID=1273749 RepID=R4T6N7_9CAUD|nr:hypothetical protein M199_gp034 [Halogranum tailed virus 1]AGM11364.1 hypothetical protein HGTV1_34 [Halogranum tailed virus 1]